MLRIIYVLTVMASLVFVCTLLRAQNNSADSSLNYTRSDRPGVVADPDVDLQQRSPRYLLRSGDSFDVEFPFSPEFNQSVVVGPDGWVTFRGAGSQHVAGQTLPQLTGTIKEAYSGILSDPVIAVVLKDFEKPYFIAAGQVGKPGKYELRSDLSLVEAVNIAGGFTDASKHSQVLLFRRVTDDRVETHVFDAKKMLASRNLQEDPHLLPGDMIFVPQNFISKIRRYIPTGNLGLYANPLLP